MSKRKSGQSDSSLLPEERNVSGRSRRSIWVVGVLLAVVLATIGVFAKNDWFRSTDPLLAKNAGASWNPLAAPLPNPTPQLSRELIYTGSRLVASIDANAQEAPPADLAVWRPTTGGWWVLGGPGSQSVNYNWGMQDDDPVEGDYDGDGKTDFAVFRPSDNNWYIVHSSTGATGQFPFGSSGDVPAPADFDGDGKTDAAVFRPGTGIGTGTWYIQQSSDSQTRVAALGNASDVPFPADHDGDGKADIALWRAANQTFYSTNSSNGLPQTVPHGQAGTPASADYDGDGKADYAVFNSSNGTWHIRHSSNGQLLNPISWGTNGDKEVQNDYDGDGKVDIAVWRNSNGVWYIMQSGSATERQVLFGNPGDIPVPAYYRR